MARKLMTFLKYDVLVKVMKSHLSHSWGEGSLMFTQFRAELRRATANNAQAATLCGILPTFTHWKNRTNYVGHIAKASRNRPRDSRKNTLASFDEQERLLTSRATHEVRLNFAGFKQSCAASVVLLAGKFDNMLENASRNLMWHFEVYGNSEQERGRWPESARVYNSPGYLKVLCHKIKINKCKYSTKLYQF